MDLISSSQFFWDIHIFWRSHIEIIFMLNSCSSYRLISASFIWSFEWMLCFIKIIVSVVVIQTSYLWYLCTKSNFRRHISRWIIIFHTDYFNKNRITLLLFVILTCMYQEMWWYFHLHMCYTVADLPNAKKHDLTLLFVQCYLFLYLLLVTVLRKGFDHYWYLRLLFC